MGIQDICEDAQAELHRRLDVARRGFDEQHDQYNCLQQDYEVLEVRLEKEKFHWREAEDTVTCLKGKSVKASASRPLALAKRKATDDCPPLSQMMFALSEPIVVSDSSPPPQPPKPPKHIKGYDMEDWPTDPSYDSKEQAWKDAFMKGVECGCHLDQGSKPKPKR